MPNPGADAPLRKVTLNLYEADCIAMEKHYGRGWSTIVRDMVHRHIEKRTLPRKRTIEGLFNDR